MWAARTGGAHAAAQNIGADDEEFVGVERLAFRVNAKDFCAAICIRDIDDDLAVEPARSKKMVRV